MQKLMLKLTTAVVLVLASLTGSFTLQHVESASGAESVVTGTLVSVSPSRVTTEAASDTNGVTFADQAKESPASIVASSVDLITAGVCAALIGCCILGLALLRLSRRGGPGPSWTATLRRMSPLASPPAPLASPIRPSLLLLSISRT